jgi:hypothetical protein
VFRRTQLNETVIYKGPPEIHRDLLYEDMADQLRRSVLRAECQKKGLRQAPRELEEHPPTARAAKRQKAEEVYIVGHLQKVSAVSHCKACSLNLYLENLGDDVPYRQA